MEKHYNITISLTILAKNYSIPEKSDILKEFFNKFIDEEGSVIRTNKPFLNGDDWSCISMNASIDDG